MMALWIFMSAAGGSFAALSVIEAEARRPGRARAMSLLGVVMLGVGVMLAGRSDAKRVAVERGHAHYAEDGSLGWLPACAPQPPEAEAKR